MAATCVSAAAWPGNGLPCRYDRHANKALKGDGGDGRGGGPPGGGGAAVTVAPLEAEVAAAVAL